MTQFKISVRPNPGPVTYRPGTKIMDFPGDTFSSTRIRQPFPPYKPTPKPIWTPPKGPSFIGPIRGIGGDRFRNDENARRLADQARERQRALDAARQRAEAERRERAQREQLENQERMRRLQSSLRQQQEERDRQRLLQDRLRTQRDAAERLRRQQEERFRQQRELEARRQRVTPGRSSWWSRLKDSFLEKSAYAEPKTQEDLPATNVELEKTEIAASPSKFTWPADKSRKPFFVRFFFPSTEVSVKEGVSRQMSAGQKAIEDAIQAVGRDISNLPISAKAELSEVFAGFSEQSPLDIHLKLNPSPEDLKSGHTGAYTSESSGQPGRAQIEIPLDLTKGLAFGGGKAVTVAKTPSEIRDVLQRTVLHEGLHALLIRQKLASENIWQSAKKSLQVNGDRDGVNAFNDLTMTFLTAQEEIFAFANEGRVYSPVDGRAEKLKTWVTMVSDFMTGKDIRLKTEDSKVSVTAKVPAKESRTWNVEFRLPTGSVTVQKQDIARLRSLNQSYKLAIAPDRK